MICALYFGSFNPLHTGHITIAAYVLQHQQDLGEGIGLPAAPVHGDHRARYEAACFVVGEPQ